MKDYHEWESTFPKALCDEAEKGLKKARLQKKIEELQKKLDELDD